jgi:hypothetical protein
MDAKTRILTTFWILLSLSALAVIHLDPIRIGLFCAEMVGPYLVLLLPIILWRLCPAGEKRTCPTCGCGLSEPGVEVCPACRSDLPAKDSCAVSVLEQMERWQHIRGVIEDTVAESCGLEPDCARGSKRLMSFDVLRSGADRELAFIKALETKLDVCIDLEWWHAEFGPQAKARLTFEQFATKLAIHIESQIATCLCGYNLTGNTSGVCPECGRSTGAQT